jgi:hypothetical protein
MNERNSIPNFVSRTLLCLECGRKFEFSVGEQQFFWSKGLAEPKRCKPCRQFRKDTIVRSENGEKD